MIHSFLSHRDIEYETVFFLKTFKLSVSLAVSFVVVVVVYEMYMCNLRVVKNLIHVCTCARQSIHPSVNP
jgi:hypothetical protein